MTTITPAVVTPEVLATGSEKVGSGIVRSLRIAARKRLQDEKVTELSTPLSKRGCGSKMKGGSASGIGTEIITPRNTKRMPDEELRRKTVVAALHNLGNTCFMNSVLQVLYRTPAFLDRINILGSEIESTTLASDILEQLKYDGLQTEFNLGWVLVSQLDSLLKQMKQIDDSAARGVVVRFSALRPYSLLETIEKLNSEFLGNQEQDAHELLKCLLMTIDETAMEVNRCRSKIRMCLSDCYVDALTANKDEKLHLRGGKVQKHDMSFFERNRGNASVTRSSNVKYGDGIRETIKESGILTFDILSDSDSTNVADLNPEESIIAGQHVEQTLSNESKGLAFNHIYDPSDKHLVVDEDISINVKSLTLAGSNVCLISLSPSTACYSPRLESPESARVLLHKLDSLQGLQQANINVGVVSNLVTELFQGYMLLKTKCLQCNMETERKEAFQEISLPIGKNLTDSIMDNDAGAELDCVEVLKLILSILDEVEQLDGDNLYYCDCCLCLVKAERRLCYELLPDILTIHLKRFAISSNGNFTKTFDGVGIPLELPCLETSCRNKKTPCHKYLLYGIVSHSGKSLISGHYRSYVRVDGNFSPLVSCSEDLSSPSVFVSDVSSLDDRKPKGFGDDHCVSDASSSFLQQVDIQNGSINVQSPCCDNISDKSCHVQQTSPVAVQNDIIGNVTPASIDLTYSEGQSSRGASNVPKGRNILPSKVTEKLKGGLGNGSPATADLLPNCGDASWYHCNDSVVSEMTKQQLDSLLELHGNNTPYMLFYHKVTVPDHSPNKL